MFATTQLGYRGSSVNHLLLRSDGELGRMLVHLNSADYRHARRGQAPADWDGSRFPWPYDLLDGDFIDGKANYGAGQSGGTSLVTIECTPIDSRWGRFLDGTFLFERSGVYVFETPDQISLPFAIDANVYEALLRDYLTSTAAQRSGCDIPGVRAADFSDDAVRDSDGLQLAASGGWYDAGDHRKWTSTTVLHVLTLATIAAAGPHGFRGRASAELDWGRDYFHHIVSEAGAVPDNIGGGVLPPGHDIETWWFDNHSGTAADGTGSRETDGVPNTGDERVSFTYYNANAQYQYVRALARASLVGDQARRMRSRVMAERAWRYACAVGHDARTLFASGELLAATELARLEQPRVGPATVERLVVRLLDRQQTEIDGLRGYFFDDEAHSDAYRSIAFSCEPALALLAAHQILREPHLRGRIEAALRMYINDYLLADATSNPFGIPPYGVWLDPPAPDRQLFRPAGGRTGVRTFPAVWTRDSIIHGNNGVVMQQAYLLASAGRHLATQSWTRSAERLLQWATGGNPDNMSLFTGIGHRHPVPFSPRALQIPGAGVIGYIGREDDTPYIETSNAVEWNTQEVWGVPSCYAALAVLELSETVETDSLDSREDAPTSQH